MAEDLVDKVKDPDHPLVIVEDDDENQRAGAEVIPIEILEQKLILTRGLVCIEFHMKREAKHHFIDCLNSGHQYDVRVRKECVEQLQNLLIEEGTPSYRLDNLSRSFRHRQRDFVFLVN